jgi:glutaredoxin-related protein
MAEGEQDDGAQAGEEGQGDSAPENVKTQEVPLAGSLVSSIPLEFEEWQWSSQGRVTIITHREPGASQPDAMVYVEAFSPLIGMFPSAEMRRFHQTVDPALVTSLSLPGLSAGLMRELSEKTGVDASSLSDGLTRAASHTMGLGLNYRSGKDTFTGWQWVGHNQHQVELRLGRTAGSWHARPNAKSSVAGVFSQASQQVPKLTGVQERYNEVLSNQSGRQDAGWPAWMLLGSAVVERDRGLHIAIMCKTTPTCPVAAELSELVANIRPADTATVEVLREQGSKSDLPDFAREQGLPFVEAEKLLSPDEIGQELRKAMGDLEAM